MSGGKARRSIPSPWTYRREWLPEVCSLVVLAALAIAMFDRTDLDLRLAARFFDPQRGFPSPRELPWAWRLLYVAPSASVTLLGIGAGLLLLASHRWTGWRPLRRYAVAVLLALALGPGLVINVVLKDFWGRPRPVHVRSFGGPWEYRESTQPGQPGRGKSFPCGHSSAGYVGTIFWLILKRRHRAWAVATLAASLLYGTLLGLGRLMTGSHFASDVAWSAILTHGTNVLLYYFLLNIPGHEDSPPQPHEGLRVSGLELVGWTTLALMVAVGALVATPYYTEFHLDPDYARSNSTSTPGGLELVLPSGAVELSVRHGTSLQLCGQAQGFGMLGSRLHRRFVHSATNGLSRFEWTSTGWFSDLDVQLGITVPVDRIATLHVYQARGSLALNTPNAPAPYIDLITKRVQVVRWVTPAAANSSSNPSPNCRASNSSAPH